MSMTQSDTAVRAVRLGAVALGLIVLPGLALGQSTFTHVHLRVPDAWAASNAAGSSAAESTAAPWASRAPTTSS